MSAARIDPQTDAAGVFDRGWLPARIEVLRDDGPMRAGDVIEWDQAARAFLCRGVVVLPWRLRWGWDVVFQAMPAGARQLELVVA